MHQPIQFATVWNDAMPSVYIQIKRPKTTIQDFWELQSQVYMASL